MAATTSSASIRPKSRTQHEPTCQWLGQCRRRVIRVELEEGAHSKAIYPRAAIFDYVEIFYNRPRRHSQIGDVNPEAFETAAA